MVSWCGQKSLNPGACCGGDLAYCADPLGGGCLQTYRSVPHAWCTELVAEKLPCPRHTGTLVLPGRAGSTRISGLAYSLTYSLTYPHTHSLSHSLQQTQNAQPQTQYTGTCFFFNSPRRFAIKHVLEPRSTVCRCVDK